MQYFDFYIQHIIVYQEEKEILNLCEKDKLLKKMYAVESKHTYLIEDNDNIEIHILTTIFLKSTIE
jgi:hypothetical protein